MRFLRWLALGTSLCAVPNLAQAGWTSIGGELVRDATNPWFIQNTPVVKACILVDEENFHLADAKPDLQHDYIEKALAYWKAEMAVQWDQIDMPNYPRVATQSFEFGPCASDTDLRFQFGVLTPDQLEYMRSNSLGGGDPRNFVSLAARTSYDAAAMKGQGFIYIAPDSGPLRPAYPNMLERPWAADKWNLVLVLAHELGHVFGLTHTASGTVEQAGFQLMSAQFPEFVINRNLNGFQHRGGIPKFFSNLDPDQQFGYCVPKPANFPSELRVFLSAPGDSVCVLTRQVDAQHVTVDVKGHGEVLGMIDLDPEHLYEDYATPIRLWVPPQQTFLKIPAWWNSQDLPIGLVRALWTQAGVYHPSKGGPDRRIIFSSGAGAFFHIGGVLDSGKLLSFDP